LNIDDFSALISTSESVQKMSTSQWDQRGSYSDVVKAVGEAAEGGPVEVYRVGQEDGVRVIYYVVGYTKGKLVGVKVKAVES